MSGRTVTACRFCKAPLEFSVLDLGEQPFSNSYPRPGEVALEKRYPLHVRLCTTCFLVQTDYDAPPSEIFSGDYAYFSSYSQSWVEHARRYADAMTERLHLNPGSRVVEIASNDGYLLQHFLSHGIPCLGVEPTRGTAEAAREKGVPTEIMFFGEAAAKELLARGHGADLVVANNVLAHVPGIADFVRGFSVLLKPEGVATFEFPHLAHLIARNEFDTIYHEHYFYLSLLAVERIFRDCGLRVLDVDQIATHGGSLRVFACRGDASHEELPGVAKVRAVERELGLNETAGYGGLMPAVDSVRKQTRAFFHSAHSQNKIVAAYGAAAKGSTFLNTCKLTTKDIVLVADANPHKQGRLMPGSHIPIVAPADLRAQQPDYVLILPWNLKREITSQLEYIKGWGGRFVTAIPQLEVSP